MFSNQTECSSSRSPGCQWISTCLPWYPRLVYLISRPPGTLFPRALSFEKKAVSVTILRQHLNLSDLLWFRLSGSGFLKQGRPKTKMEEWFKWKQVFPFVIKTWSARCAVNCHCANLSARQSISSKVEYQDISRWLALLADRTSSSCIVLAIAYL